MTLSLCLVWTGLWARRSFGQESHAGPPCCRVHGLLVLKAGRASREARMSSLATQRQDRWVPFRG